jgi:hypothetical protein
VKRKCAKKSCMKGKGRAKMARKKANQKPKGRQTY